jgi:hypothetical protein
LSSSPLRKLIWIFAALAAMLLLAPLAASAHESGHLRAAAPAQMAAHHSDTSTIADRAIVAAPVQVFASQAGDLGALKGDPLCHAGCCFGMGCCAGTIVSDVPALDPPAGLQLRVAHAPQPLRSVRLTSLLEPPNALA